MTNKQIKHNFQGMNKDFTKSKFPTNLYYDGNNIRIIATDSQSTGSITNEKGNEFILTIPIPTIDGINKKILYGPKELSYTTSEIDENYLVPPGLYLESGEQIIIGHTVTRDSIILFTTDDAGFDCIWKVDNVSHVISLLYLRNLNFSKSNPILVVNNFENSSIDKIYWVDGLNQMRFINLKHSILNQDLEELIDVPASSIENVSKFTLTQPIINDIISGGGHTSGMIMYAYNLYRLNSSQTKISPLSELISLDRGDFGGGDLNEVVAQTPIVSISDIDSNFTHIKTYSIKYTSLNQIPVISLIDDREIPTSRNIEVFDDATIISTISIEELLFLGSDILIPENINSKDGRMFFANYKEINFDIDLDFRAYSFDNSVSPIARVYDNLFLNGSVPDGQSFFDVDGTNYDDIALNKFDSVNLNYNVYQYQSDGSTFGGEGQYIKYELTQETTNTESSKFFKDFEIYRLGIQFYNEYGQISLPKWIADFRALNGNLEGLYNSLEVELKPDFYTFINTSSNFPTIYDIPIGYKILIAERTYNDKTIVANGILSTMMFIDKPGEHDSVNTSPAKRQKGKQLSKLPNFLLRNCNELTLYGNTTPLKKCIHLEWMSGNGPRNAANEFQQAYASGTTDRGGSGYQFNPMLQLYSPEILFKEPLSLNNSLQLRIKGSLNNKYNAVWSKNLEGGSGATLDEAKGYDGVSTHFSASVLPIINDPYEGYNSGMISQTSGSQEDRFTQALYYRVYGDVEIDDDFVVNPNIVLLSIPLTEIVGSDPEPDPAEPLVYISNGGKAVSTTLDIVYSENSIIYDIVPDVGYTTVVYDVKICSNISGSDVLVSLTGVMGTQNISWTSTFTPTFDNPTETFNYFLLIESATDLYGTVDVNVFIEDNPVTLHIEKESLLNPFNVQTLVTPSNPFFVPAPIANSYNIYGSPELTEKAQDFKSYNNDRNYRYCNSLQSVITDGDTGRQADGPYGRKIISINSWGNRCITLVTGDDNIATEHWDRPPLEDIFSQVGLTGDNNGLIGELVKTDVDIYLGNIYGGNSFEDKKRSNYLEVGKYTEINSLTPSYRILSPGDTFVNNFKFERILKTDTIINIQGVVQISEIIDFLTETTVDLKNRKDLSLNTWDVKFQPSDEEYHKYNTVYSQTPNLILRKDLNFNFKKSKKFDTNVIASKIKSPGEIIDNWTDIQPNEILTLDGKHGAINSLTEFNDELYTFQDKAVAFLSINPRTQVQGSDGLQIELGSGSALSEYKYVSTEAGTLNKWSVVKSPKGIYFYDTLNRSINLFRGVVNGISDVKGLHTYFDNNILTEELKINNPIIKQGVNSGFDYINNDVFMTFHQKEGLIDKSFTVSFNETSQSFVSFYDYKPSRYISKGDIFITTDPTNTMIYDQYEGEYNNYYGETYPSNITLLVNPESDLDTVFDNIMYKSEIYLDDIDQPDKTLTQVQLFSEYQDSGLVPLILGRSSNLRRKFRDWNAILPRNAGTRERIRNPWIYLKLQLDNTDNYKMILHDIIISYSV